MKIIYAITDMHVNLDSIKAGAKYCKKYKVDFTICPGDYTWFGSGAEETLEEMDKYPCKVYLTFGNHEEYNTQKKITKQFKNIVFLHKQSKTIGDVFLIVYGGGGFALNDKKFLEFANSEIKKNKAKFSIMITHGPPHGTLIDIVRNNYVGNKDYTKFIKQHKIDLALSGHIHDTEELHDTINKSVVANPGYRGQIFIINDKKLSKKEFEDKVNKLKQFKNKKKRFVENVCIINPC